MNVAVSAMVTTWTSVLSLLKFSILNHKNHVREEIKHVILSHSDVASLLSSSSSLSLSSLKTMQEMEKPNTPTISMYAALTTSPPLIGQIPPPLCAGANYNTCVQEHFFKRSSA